MRVSEFHYELPESAIAQTAIEPRHDALLLDSRDMTDHKFLDLADLLTPGDLVVVNETRVRAARLVGRRAETGGAIELLLLERTSEGLWEALARPSRRLRAGTRIEFDGLSAVVERCAERGVVVVSLDAEDVETAISELGSVPLPPYFVGSLDHADRYQTMFAKQPGSAAAPTAGLHFTDYVVDKLKRRGIGLATVDLHVSLDTFRPMTTDLVEDHQIHSEWCSVPETTANALSETQQRGRRVVAVGTTVVRTLESFADGAGTVSAGERQTDLFIRPGYRFKAVDAMVTNFHLPGSSLLVLLAAFMGDEWRRVYRVALDRGYRFLSFGDAMYAERARF